METFIDTQDQAPPDMSRVTAPPQNGPADIQALPAPVQPPGVLQPSQGGRIPAQWWLPQPPQSAQQQPWSALPFMRAAFSQLPPNIAGPAIKQALMLEGRLGFEADTQAGMPVAEAQAKWANKLWPEHAIPAPQAPFTPKEVDIGGHKMIQISPQHFSFAPAPPFDPNAPVKAQPIMLNGIPIPGHSAVTTKGGVHILTDPKDMTSAQREMVLNRLIKSEEESLKGSNTKEEEKVIEDRLKDYRKQHRELVDSLMGKGTGKTAFPPAPPRAQRKTGQVYDSPKGPHRWLGDGWEKL